MISRRDFIKRTSVTGAIMALAALTGCGSDTSSTSSTTDESSSEKIKIGITIYSTTDATSGPMANNIQLACDGLGADLVIATDNSSLEDELANIENLINNGCQAVFILPYSDDAIPRIVKICDDAGVYFGYYWYDLTEQDTHDASYNSEYFLGNIYEDDVWSAYTAMKTLHEAGVTKVAEFGLPTGRTTTDKRDKGIQQACDEFGMEVLVTDRTNTSTSDEAASSVESMVSAYPDLEGICIAGMTQTCLPGVIQTLSNLGLTGKVKVSCIDFNENQMQYFEDGAVSGIVGGHFTGAAWLAVLAINKLQGTPLTDEAQSIQDNFIVLQSYEDAKNYNDYLYEEPPYTADEYAEMSKKTNPDYTLDDLLATIQSYSIEDVMTRHNK